LLPNAKSNYRKTSSRSSGLILDHLTSTPACIRDPAYTGDPATVKTLPICHVEPVFFVYILH